MRRWFVLLALAACQRDNYIQLQFGPSGSDVGSGYECKDGTGKELFANAVNPADHDNLDFTLVIDVVHFQGKSPGCIPDDIIATCKDNPSVCTFDPTSDRKCVAFSIPDTGDVVSQALAAVYGDKANLFDDAPGGTVAIRVVPVPTVDVSDCSHLVLDASNVMGCLMSCPLVLDDFSGVLELHLDVLGLTSSPTLCDAAIVACAQFPQQ